MRAGERLALAGGVPAPLEPSGDLRRGHMQLQEPEQLAYDHRPPRILHPGLQLPRSRVVDRHEAVGRLAMWAPAGRLLARGAGDTLVGLVRLVLGVVGVVDQRLPVTPVGRVVQTLVRRDPDLDALVLAQLDERHPLTDAPAAARGLPEREDVRAEPALPAGRSAAQVGHHLIEVVSPLPGELRRREAVVDVRRAVGLPAVLLGRGDVVRPLVVEAGPAVGVGQSSVVARYQLLVGRASRHGVEFIK